MQKTEILKVQHDATGELAARLDLLIAQGKTIVQVIPTVIYQGMDRQYADEVVIVFSEPVIRDSLFDAYTEEEIDLATGFRPFKF